jgi:ATP-binding cassette subfamily B (MDR/TAP) protein 1
VYVLKSGTEDVEDILEEQQELEDQRPFSLKHQSLAAPALRPLTMGNWMFDMVADLTKSAQVPAKVGAKEPHRVSGFIPAEAFSNIEEVTSESVSTFQY